MRSIYICEQGAKVSVDGGRLVVTPVDADDNYFHLFKIDSILAFGNINFTTPAINTLLYHKISTTFFSINGNCKGMIAPVKSKNIYLRISQFKLLSDKSFCLQQARQIVMAKINNQISVLRKYAYNHPDISLQEHISSLLSNYQKTSRSQTISSLMGIEGISTRAYFRGFSKMFRSEIKFEKRKKYPSIDPANALLSFGYVLLANEICGYLETIGFDPYFGFYHQPRYGRLSLALDLIEPFRQPVIDRFVLLLANKQIISEDDFTNTDSGLRLKNKPLKNYLKHYEKWLNRPIKNNPDNSFRKIVFKHCNAFQKAIKDKNIYVPFIFK